VGVGWGCGWEGEERGNNKYTWTKPTDPKYLALCAWRWGEEVERESTLLRGGSEWTRMQHQLQYIENHFIMFPAAQFYSTGLESW